jgi:NADH dehydrogenase [ubiquinone] 1 alpha subcomplex assembly factor 7
MTPLAHTLVARIQREGPIGVAAYMEACLHDPAHGYYRRRNAIGRAGDFITAPEISQVFGELIGLWCAVVWQQMGSPATLRLVELGPGRGTLMRDALRAVRTVPAFQKTLHVHLVETNASLEAEQRATLQDEDVEMTWSDDVDAAMGAPVIVIANEFLDTLPIAQWVRRHGHWLMRGVGLDGEGRLAFVEGESDPAFQVPPGIEDGAREGEIFETRDAALQACSDKLAALGAPLAALFIDYGHVVPAMGDTLQAMRAHRYDDPLAASGEVDLTAQVDFSAVAAAMKRCKLACDGPVTQAEFLGSLGIAERASRLMAANPAKAAHIEADIARLMAPGGMGTRFHAIGVRSPGLAPLPGF